MLVGAGATVLPALIDGPAPAWVVVAISLCALAGAGLWVAARTGRFTKAHRDRLALALVLTATGGLLASLAVDGQYRPEAYLLLAGALICSLTSVPTRALRWSVQAVTVAAAALALHAAGRGVIDVAFPVALLVAVAALADVYATALVSSRRAEVTSRADAERRAELLQAVRGLASHSAAEAMEAAVRTLTGLGHTTAGVAVVRGDVLEPVCLEGMPPRPRALRRGDGLAWRAIERNQTVVTADYHQEYSRIADRDSIVSAVVAPIRVTGEPVGVVIAARSTAGVPGQADIEVAEVLAAHLGGVLHTQGRMRRQQELLERMAELDRMRTGFVVAVSSELRDPLTVVRGVGQTLVSHSDDVDVLRRHGLLERLCVQAEDLRRTIDALLDFSRFQAERDEVRLTLTAVRALLTPVVQSTGAVASPPLSELTGPGYVVQVDATVVQHALELLIQAGGSAGTPGPRATLSVEVEAHAVVVLVDREIPPSALVRSLAGQLLVVGGARLEEGPVPRVCLPSVGSASETGS